MPPPNGPQETTPLAALSLLDLASVPRASPTTSISVPSAPNPASTRSPPPLLSRPTTTTGGTVKQRRLSSASQSRRRLSDATAAVAAARSNAGPMSLNALSLSTSPSEGMMDDDVQPGKKKGAIYRCENCSKVYRHPNCLLKHRWEHSPHWREASKFLLSKHQQVQLLEAAAILSHITPRQDGNGTGTSLPDDRSLWPSYLSGGVLSAPSTKVPSSSHSSTSVPKPSHHAVKKAESTTSEEDRKTPSLSVSLTSPPPPYNRHRHTRTSSSMSSSYTRSSVRGSGRDEDEDEDEEDDGEVWRARASSGEEFEFEVLDEKDELGGGGAGMEIDMEL